MKYAPDRSRKPRPCAKGAQPRESHRVRSSRAPRLPRLRASPDSLRIAERRPLCCRASLDAPAHCVGADHSARELCRPSIETKSTSSRSANHDCPSASGIDLKQGALLLDLHFTEGLAVQEPALLPLDERLLIGRRVVDCDPQDARSRRRPQTRSDKPRPVSRVDGGTCSHRHRKPGTSVM